MIGRTPRPWARRIGLGLFALALLALVGVTWFTHRLMTEVLTGRAFAGQADPGQRDPLRLGYRGDPGRAFDLPFENLVIDTPLGPAPAWWVPPATASARTGYAAVVIHGIGGAREDGYLYLPELHAAGLPVLLLTYRNDPGAPPAPDGLHSFGLGEWADVDAAIAALRDRGTRKIVLVAASMGGAIAGQFLARSDHADMVEALILDAPAVDFPAVLRHVTGRLALPLHSIATTLAIPAFAVSHGINLSQARVQDVLAAFDGPVLILHGLDDRLVPPQTSLALLDQRQGQTHLLLAPGDHLQTRSTAPARLSAALRAFLANLP